MTEKEMEAVKKENEQLKKENDQLRQLGPKEKLYDRIPLSLATMNKIVGVLLVVLVATLVIALIDR